MKKLLKNIKLIKNNNEGSSIVIVTISFTVLLIILAFVIDLGMAYTNTSHIQNASDASALAAAKYLPVLVTDEQGIIEIKQVAIDYANKNDVFDVTYEDVILGGVINGRYTNIEVIIKRTVNATLSQVIGIDNINLQRSSVAGVAPVERLRGVVPFAIRKNTIDSYLESGYTTHIELKFGGGSGTEGDFGVIDLDGVTGGGANDVELWLADGYTPEISSGEELFPVETGNMANPILRAVQSRYDDCTHFPEQGGCNQENFVEDCPRVLLVPVVADVLNKYVQIVGFSAFILEPIIESDFVYGSLIELTTNGVASDSTLIGGIDDYGLYSVKLTK